MRAQTILETVPRQGGMLMPEVWYHADSDSVTVDLSAFYDVNGYPIINQLTPLLVSDPGDYFDPASPWFDCLDPSQQGMAFSRRYGWDMDVMTDYVPDNRALWIRDLGSSPELEFYNYMDAEYDPDGSAPTWDPMLGTAGTSNAIYWNEGMWHMGVAAPPAHAGTTNYYSGTFEVYVVNTDTGEEVTNSSSGPLVLKWTDIPDGRPVLTISNNAPGGVVLTWPTSAQDWSLVSASNLNSANWTAVTNPVILSASQSLVNVESLPVQEFFRLALSETNATAAVISTFDLPAKGLAVRNIFRPRRNP